jgi:hypothetical protein
MARIRSDSSCNCIHGCLSCAGRPNHLSHCTSCGSGPPSRGAPIGTSPPLSQPYSSTNCLRAISIAPLFLSLFALELFLPDFLLSITAPPCEMISSEVDGSFVQSCIRFRHSRGETHSRTRSSFSGLTSALSWRFSNIPIILSGNSLFGDLDGMNVPDRPSILTDSSLEIKHHETLVVFRGW